MQWSDLFDSEHQPSNHHIKEFVRTPLWDNLDNHLRQDYNVQPKLFYSRCSMDKGFWMGWNVKYQKNGKSLCTLYPKQGYFVALIAVGAKEMVETNMLIRFCDEYTQKLYGQTKLGAVGMSLPIEVKSENILCDVKGLIALRSASRKKTR